MRSIILALGVLAMTLSSAAPAPRAVTLTAYSAHAGQTDSSPSVSACGPNRPQQIAVSRELFRRVYKCGDWVRVYRPDTKRWHRYVVWDTMNARHRARADLMMPTQRAAIAFGRRQGLIAAQ